MNSREAKNGRRLARMTEAVTQAHDRLHRDDVDGCHDMLHQALGTGELVSTVAPLSDMLAFDSAFRDLCLRMGARASYVLATPEPSGLRLLSGGDAEIDAIVAKHLR